MRTALRRFVAFATAWLGLIVLKLLVYNREPAAAAIALVLALFMFGIYLFLRSAQEVEPFVAWLRANEQAVRAGSAPYCRRRIGLDTECVRYGGCTSIIVWTGKYASSWNPADRALGEGCVYSLVALSTGWWSISGLVWTFKVLVGNARGGERVKAGYLMGARH